MASMFWPIVRQAIRHPRRQVIVDDQRTWRYLDLLGGALHLAQQIEKVSGSQHVGIMLPTSGMTPMAVLACWMLDRVVVPINYLLGESERQYVIDHSDVDTVITVGKMLEYLGSEPQGVNLLKLDEVKFDGVPPLRMPPLHTPSDQVAAILYTSGTSGRPKGVMLTHGNLRANVRDAVKHSGIDASSGFAGVLPQFHCFGLTVLTLLPLAVGCKVVYTARFVPTKLLQKIREHRPDIFMAIPSMYAALASLKNATPDDMSSIRLAISGAEPLAAETRERFYEKFGVRILEGYGLTETSPGVSWSLPDHNRDGSVGPPLPNVTIEIRDSQGRPLPAGEKGEICIAGPNIMAGYYKMPDETAKVIDDRGFFRTGDMGKIDIDGLLSITGRIKEMLIIGGENVFPREIEEVLSRHPAVQASAVVGRQDPSRGEVPVAFVEILDGHEFEEAKLRAHCREHLAGYKVPKRIVRMDELPRNPTGKVLRRKLSDQLDELLDEESED